MDKERSTLNFETKAALFLLEILNKGKIIEKHPTNKLLTMEYKGVAVTIERYVNEDGAKPHYVYTVRDLLGNSLYGVAMDKNIQDETLHSKLAHKLYSNTFEAERTARKLSQSNQIIFNGLETEFNITLENK